ncbi:hypothetical protein LC087_16215 [Bacillus carboniphilus]|uniref:Uncharacterized protein n=1 Tax=Bacillus carboniphilus TaxID=86663 RepID=A0ABY9JX59_9BACI|nr:hypothetical protein [Bacillus carboniphilus]WLR42256.1 hypothetical protein LC087_16215 [Bacillus carboniphilus]
MDKTRKIMAIGTFFFFIIVGGHSLYRWIKYGIIEGGSLFISFVILSWFFNILTWGDHNGGNDKDELGEHITKQSAKVSYFVLMILASLVLFISEGESNLNNIENIPLLIVVCLTFVTLPITEFIYSKKYRL